MSLTLGHSVAVGYPTRAATKIRVRRGSAEHFKDVDPEGISHCCEEDGEPARWQFMPVCAEEVPALIEALMRAFPSARSAA